MSIFQFIQAEDYSIQMLLLFDRWMIQMIVADATKEDAIPQYQTHLAAVLYHHPNIAWYFSHRAPERSEMVKQLQAMATKNLDAIDVRTSELYVLSELDTFVIYVDPEAMNHNCNYIFNWNKDRLLELTDFHNKIVLDLGSGTGRLAFAASSLAKHVYASEPVAMLREYMRDQIVMREIRNMSVLDGTVEHIPYEENTFDIVMSGHVVGDDYETELNEITRVVKHGGFIIDCIGDDDRIRPAPNQELIQRGFECFYHKSSLGGDIYRYRKQVWK